jgi:hypothetical protein
MADEEPLGKRIALGIVPNVAVDRFVALSNRGVSEHLYLRGRNVKVTNKVTLELLAELRSTFIVNSGNYNAGSDTLVND